MGNGIHGIEKGAVHSTRGFGGAKKCEEKEKKR